jgi:hypothetical protein
MITTVLTLAILLGPHNYTPIPAQFRPQTTCTTICSPVYPHACTTTCR